MKCVHCLLPISAKSERAANRYWDKVLHGWAHMGCDPEQRPEGLESILGVSGRERQATADMASNAGHVTRYERGDGTLSRGVCTCGWTSPWMPRSRAAELRREHEKQAAVYG